jgi:hypothetical protein
MAHKSSLPLLSVLHLNKKSENVFKRDTAGRKDKQTICLNAFSLQQFKLLRLIANKKSRKLDLTTIINLI